LTLEQQLQQKIALCEAAFNVFPGAVIIHDLRTQHVAYMSEMAAEGLNTTVDELQEMGMEYHHKFFNPDEAMEYVPKILGLLERNNSNEFVSFFQQVRPLGGAYSWWLSSIRIFMRDEQGLPVFTITVSIPIDPKHNFAIKVERLLQENNFLHKHKEQFASLTKRELEIIKLMATDNAATAIAAQLHLSEDTVKTHRRNIKRKIAAKNQYDVVKFAQAFDLV